jgi:ABC-2 type transport system ATP-binding protein
MKMDAIRVNKLRKSFDGFTAVDDISFTVPEGELFGLLGPNGAGKTTTINMLATLLKPTSGEAWVGGCSVAADRNGVRRSIGIVFQEAALDNRLSGRENLQFHAMMYGVGREERKQRIATVLELVELADKADILVEKYSGGMKRRLEIARGLIHRPKVLFLDEPTLGLDTQTRRHIWDYIKKLNRESGVTIILTTHYMEEADFLCQRVAIMDGGKFAAIDSPARLKDALGGDVVSLEIGENIGNLLEQFKALPWIRSLKQHEDVLSMSLEHGERRIPELIQMAQRAGATVHCVQLRKPSLEDVFLNFTGRSIREQESEAGNHVRNRAAGPHGRR